MKRTFLQFALILPFFVTACGGATSPASAPVSSTSGAQPAVAATAPSRPASAGSAAAPAAASASAGATAKGRLTVVSGVDVEAMDPYVTTSAPSQSVMHAIFDTLVVRDAKLNIMPSLATSWDNPDDSTWVFHLRQGVKFHNGDAFNAAAVKFSYDRFMDPAIKNPQMSFMKPVKSVQVVDDNTVKFVTDGPYAAFLNVLFDYFYIMDPAVKGQDASKMVIGTGPFQFVEWKPGQDVLLKANPSYWGPKPKVQAVAFRPIAEAATRLVELKSGGADVISPLQQTQYAEADQAGLKVAKLQGPTITIMFNTADKPFDNPKVREAANYAVDKQAIIKGLMRGAAYQLPSVLRPGQLGYDNSLQPYPHDVAKAKALLAEAGVSNANVQLGSPDGRYQNDKLVSQAVGSQLTDAGLHTNVNVSEWNSYVQNIIGHKLQFFLIAQTAVLSEIALPQTLMPKGALYQNYANPQVAALIDKGGKTLDQKQREAIYKQANQLLHDDPPWIFLFAQEDAYGLSKRVTGFAPRPDQLVWVADIGLAS